MNVLKMFDLTGQVAVITGAGSGLGFQFAEAMAEAGARVVCGDISADNAEKTASHVAALGGEAVAVHADVTLEADVDKLFAAAVDKFGTVDIAFANAGIGDPVPLLLHEYPTENWDKVVAINMAGVFYTCRAALKIMFPRKRGKIINTASMWGLAGPSSVFPIPAYAATKGAVVNLTRELALQYAPHNIQVNAICPGFFRTRISDGAFDDNGFVETVSAFTPMGRVAEAAEIKGTALYLASAASSFTTGLMLVTDGGCMAK
jgi:NAD(P)-dependent dehydrogenase (short-subunit alcohol dehydrogenase family)